MHTLFRELSHTRSHLHLCEQELALRMAGLLQDFQKCTVTFLSCGTDGQDGPTDATGAVVNNATIHNAGIVGLDYQKFLAQNDSYTFFQQLDERTLLSCEPSTSTQHTTTLSPSSSSSSSRTLVKTGLTGTNVMDLVVILLSAP
eukprot:m.122367 g.122367  ORF g.122367 m.122367 type:complete len:144 (-) comp13728_c1_seq7:1582-2013(-)